VAVSNLQVRRPKKPDAPSLELRDTADAVVANCRRAEKTGVFLSVSGRLTENVILWGNHVGDASSAVQAGPEVSQGAVSGI
jgi:hypothetical protein